MSKQTTGGLAGSRTHPPSPPTGSTDEFERETLQRRLPDRGKTIPPRCEKPATHTRRRAPASPASAVHTRSGVEPTSTAAARQPRLFVSEEGEGKQQLGASACQPSPVCEARLSTRHRRSWDDDAGWNAPHIPICSCAAMSLSGLLASVRKKFGPGCNVVAIPDDSPDTAACTSAKFSPLRNA